MVFVKHQIYTQNTSNDQQFRLNKISEIKDYFNAEIKEREKTNEQGS